jgi:hypothetical protein
MPRLSRDKKEQIQRAYKEGKSPTEIAKELGVARSSIYRITNATTKKQTKSRRDDSSVSSASGSDSDAESGDDEDDDGDDEDNNPSIVKKFLKMSNVFADELGLKEEKPNPDNEDKSPHLVIQEERQNNDAKANFVRMMMENDRPEMEVPSVAQMREQIRRPMPTIINIPDPDFDRGEVIQRIMFNVEHFAPMLRKIIGDNADDFVQSLSGRSDRELEGLLQVIDRTRAVGNLATTFKHTFYMAAQGAEVVTSQFLNMRTRGFVQALQAQDTEIQMAIKELAIDNYNKFNKMNRPEMRLGMLAVMTLIQVDSTARLREAMGQAPSVNSSTEEKYGDL